MSCLQGVELKWQTSGAKGPGYSHEKTAPEPEANFPLGSLGSLTAEANKHSDG